MGDKEGALLLLLQCSFMILPAMEGVKIAAYNVRVFGVSKLQNQVAMDMITQVWSYQVFSDLHNYDCSIL